MTLGRAVVGCGARQGSAEQGTSLTLLTLSGPIQGWTSWGRATGSAMPMVLMAATRSLQRVRSP